MSDSTRMVLHAFAALADLGEEIAETSDFEEMVRSALHVVLGAMGIRRGAVAEFDREHDSLRFVAARGFDEEFKRTPGINITKWPVKIDSDQVQAHIWDFGGQEIMHGTHRFFMTERALYLVFISGREGTEDRDAEYWLSLVRSFAGDAPVIVMLNKRDEYSFELNRDLLRDKYGNVTFMETDSLTGHGMAELRKKICQLAGKLPGLKAAWPGEWRRIKDELPAQKKSWLTFEDFREFCKQLGITEAKDQELLAKKIGRA